MGNTLIISGEAYVRNRSNSLVNMTEQFKYAILEEMKELNKGSNEVVKVSNMHLLKSIGSGFISISDRNNYIYVREGIINMPTIESARPIPVSVPRTLIISSRGVIKACTLVDDDTLRAYPLSNAYEISYNSIPGLGSAPLSNLCLGSSLDGLFIKANINQVPGLVEAIFTSRPNTDLNLRAGFVQDKFIRLIKSLLASNKLSKTEWAILRNKLVMAINNRTINQHLTNYDNMLHIASIFTSNYPEFTNNFWRDCFVDDDSFRINISELERDLRGI